MFQKLASTLGLKLKEPKRLRRFLLNFFLILFLISQTITGIFTPLTPPFFKTQEVRAAGESWYNSSWNYRKKITIDHTKVASDEANFPVLISLDSLSNINANGTDIRFTSSDGTTELPREIESYSSGSLRAWVNAPTLSSSSDTVIYMYYGNSAATEPAASSTYGSQNVWKTDGVDTSAVMVQHMKDTTTSTITDSTANANNGTKFAANEPIEATGEIGKGQTFDGTNDYVNASNGASLNIGNNTTNSALNNGTYDAFGLLVKTSSDTIIYFAREGTSHIGNDGKIFRQQYTISTNTWGSRTYVYSNGTYDARGVGGGIIGTHIYLFFGLYNATNGTCISMGYMVSTDLTGTTWSAYTPIDVSPLTAFLPYSHIVQTDDPNTFLQPFYGNTGSTYYVKYFKTTDGGNTWSVGGTVYSGTTWLDETSIEYIGNGKMGSVPQLP